MSPLARRLLESSEVIIAVDVQPAYGNYIGFDLGEFCSRLEAARHVVFMFNGDESGLSDDNPASIAEWFADAGYQLPDVQWVDKGYAFFRDLMDHGVSDESIVALAKHMLNTGIQDWRELPEGDPVADATGVEDREGMAFYLPHCTPMLRRLGHVTLMGGAETECLKEVELLLQAVGTPYSVDRNFTY